MDRQNVLILNGGHVVGEGALEEYVGEQFKDYYKYDENGKTVTSAEIPEEVIISSLQDSSLTAEKRNGLILVLTGELKTVTAVANSAKGQIEMYKSKLDGISPDDTTMRDRLIERINQLELRFQADLEKAREIATQIQRIKEALPTDIVNSPQTKDLENSLIFVSQLSRE